MFYPININLDNIKITIIGGGKVSFRKCKNFLDFNKSVRVVSPKFIDEFQFIKNDIEMIYDVYKEEYIKDSFIVVAGTNDKSINKEIASYCKNNGKLVNVVDDINISNYTVPSYIKRGDLLISVSTNGKSPSLCSKIRKDLEKKYDNSYEEYINLLGEIRDIIIKDCKDIKKRKAILNNLINLNIEELILLRNSLLKNSIIFDNLDF